jgi:methionyl-tRNA formyltransferase
VTGRPALLAIGRSRLLYDSVEHLAAQGYRFGALVTAPGNPEHDVGPAEFEALAARLHCPCFVTRSADSPELRESLEAARVTAGISVNWQFLLPQRFLDLLHAGLLNLHLGNLPDYKGNATANWAILNGEREIHANVHRVVADLDAGDVLARERIGIDDWTYVGDILDRATDLAPGLFQRALENLGSDRPEVVVAGSTAGLRCYPRLPQDGLLDWTQPAYAVSRLVRASSRPYPGAFSYLGERRVVVWRASVAPPEAFLAVPGHVLGADRTAGTLRVACGQGAIDLEEVSVDGEPVSPSELTRSIRARFSATPAPGVRP